MTENSADLIIKLDGDYHGVMPIHDAILLLKNIEEAFLASIKSTNPMVKSFPSLIFSSMNSGCTELGWKTEVKQKKLNRDLPLYDNDEIEKLGKQAIITITDIADMILHNVDIDDNQIPVRTSVYNTIKLVNNGFRSISFSNNINNKQVKVEKREFKNIVIKEKATSDKVFSKKHMKIIGTFVSIDVNVSKEECWINSPFLDEIRCKYPKHLESAVCHFIMPPREDVVVEGEMNFKEISGEIDFFTIKQIFDLNTHNKTLLNNDSPQWNKHVGILKDIKIDKTADEMTNWMIDTLWG